MVRTGVYAGHLKVMAVGADRRVAGGWVVDVITTEPGVVLPKGFHFTTNVDHVKWDE